uniref:Uncharacterized protein n=1 Tax=Trichuris muris TaxID=70415 RepID=A0A5S6QHG1_TRIMR
MAGQIRGHLPDHAVIRSREDALKIDKELAKSLKDLMYVGGAGKDKSSGKAKESGKSDHRKKEVTEEKKPATGSVPPLKEGGSTDEGKPPPEKQTIKLKPPCELDAPVPEEGEKEDV